MVEVLPSCFHPCDIAHLDGRAYMHLCQRLDSLESYTPSSPLIIWSSCTDHDVGSYSIPDAGCLDYEEHISRRRLRDILQRCRVGNIGNREYQKSQLSLLALLFATLRRSLLICKKTAMKGISMDIGWPTNVRHVAHVTFDRYNGFLGLPTEFEVEIPRRVPSASASVFGVSSESMQCSYDRRGNSVPTILLLMQEKLYRLGGLQVEGIFRINAENSHEEDVRQELSKGIVPDGVDLHCLAGLIKAWFRELPKGVLDSLAPEQVMCSSTEEQCIELVKQLPSTEAALLDWAINLMADVVQEEESNKMNARNIAMVFAPNMVQIVDPLTALMHAVQVMNFLKTLILKTVKDRQEAALDPKPVYTCAFVPFKDDFDSDNGSPFLTRYSEHELLEDGDLIQEAFMPPANSPNEIGSSLDEDSSDQFEFLSDFDEQLYSNESICQDEVQLFDSLIENNLLERVAIKTGEHDHFVIIYPENGCDPATFQGIKVIDHCSKLGEKNLDHYQHVKDPVFLPVLDARALSKPV